ncbi:DoxX family protein [Actinomycetospora atypica]|uniref:DoxX family protein n=1 Tax=Actinomycetospora atypica TaxID=1290095 RepID=A0ABV9YRI5_9PSEU
MITTERASRTPSRTAAAAASVCRVLVSVFLVFVAVSKLLRLPFMVDTTVNRMGFPVSVMPVIGTVLLVCLALYLVPRTEILGAVALSGVVGGAVAVHLRIGAPLLPDYLVVLGFGVLVWLPLYLRNDLVRRIVRDGR